MIEDMFSLKGKTAFVTGSSRGIGKEIAMTFGMAGAKVIFHASRESEKLDLALKEAEGLNIRTEKAVCDISDTTALENAVKSMTAPDILVMNASVQQYMTLEEYDEAEFEREFNTNVRASFFMVNKFLPVMKKRGFGRIISIGSVNQIKQSPRLSFYAATKSAQLNMILNLARSYAKYGITANNIAPGVIATDRNRETLADHEAAKAILEKIPAGRFGTPRDCSGLALLLASEAGGYITGNDIVAAGGMQL